MNEVTELSREQAFDILQNEWATYVARFQHLSPAVQAEFLTRQGYDSLTSLLAHILAWWEEGRRVIVHLQDDPDFTPPDYEVGTFNAQAVERFRSWSEPAILEAFEQAQSGWSNFIENLPASAFQNQQVVYHLYLELVFHMQEHVLPLQENKNNYSPI
jgi:hypothetical protein